jgi:hypothetical protein
MDLAQVPQVTFDLGLSLRKIARFLAVTRYPSVDSPIGVQPTGKKALILLPGMVVANCSWINSRSPIHLKMNKQRRSPRVLDLR